MPTRKQQVESLTSDYFDVLVIGGGAIGCGCALESASRGFKTALIEAGDFASGASCKSSKLIEGSNSYLHAAIQGADLQQIFMLQQVLNERATMLTIAPHLNRVQPMLMPIYSPLRLPLYWLGLKMYDAMAGMSNVRGSHFLSKHATLNEFPLLRKEGLLGSLVYYDVQLDDARMCLALAITAAKHRATVANYVRLLEVFPTCQQDCRSVLVKDTLNDKSFIVTSRVIINATGAGTDAVRKLDDCRACPIAVPHLGTHIALPGYYGSQNFGLLFPSIEGYDDALIMLPFENRLLVGSLDVERPEPTKEPPAPTAEEVDCLLAQTQKVLEDCCQLSLQHVLSAWTGVKPSIICPSTDNADDSKEPHVITNFLLEVSGNQMITLAGGRWSTYRVMAVDAVNTAIESCLLEPQSKASVTSNLLLDGAENYCCMLPLDLVHAYDLPMDVAQHLAESYGSNAPLVLAHCSDSSTHRLHPKFPYIDAEVIYACQREYACHLEDVIARRLRVAFVDAVAAYDMLPTVLEIMTNELHWDESQQKTELQMAQKFLQKQMGLCCIINHKKDTKLNKCALLEARLSVSGETSSFNTTIDSSSPTISHCKTETYCRDASRPVQARLPAQPQETPPIIQATAPTAKIACGLAAVSDSNSLHRSSIVRGSSSVVHFEGDSGLASRAKSCKKPSTTVRRGVYKTPDKPPNYVRPDSVPENVVVTSNAKNIGAIRRELSWKIHSERQKNRNECSSHEKHNNSRQSNKGDNDVFSSGKALEGISRTCNRGKFNRSTLDNLTLANVETATGGSKRPSNPATTRLNAVGPTSSTDNLKNKYGFVMPSQKSQPASKALALPKSVEVPTDYMNCYDVTSSMIKRGPAMDVSNQRSSKASALERVEVSEADKPTDKQGKPTGKPKAHPRSSDSPAVSKPNAKNSGKPKSCNTRHASTISIIDSDAAATVPNSNADANTDYRINAASDQSIVGADSPDDDTVTILRYATAGLKEIKENIRKVKPKHADAGIDAAQSTTQEELAQETDDQGIFLGGPCPCRKSCTKDDNDSDTNK